MIMTELETSWSLGTVSKVWVSSGKIQLDSQVRNTSRAQVIL